MDPGGTPNARRLRDSLSLSLLFGCCLYQIFGAPGFASADKLRLCTVRTVHTDRSINRACPELTADQESQAECVIVNDRLNCLRRLATGDAEFAILEPEDVVAASSNAEYDVLITHELRLFGLDTQRFAMAAVVSSDIKSSSDLIGKKFCHGGLENTDDYTRVFATYFQNWIIPRRCDRDKTLLENEISRLSSFFGSACFPGAWSPDAAYDVQLKLKYKNLCALCDNPAGCSHNDKYHGREGALLCLTDNAADVAWVRLEDALRHFKQEGINETMYNYLCPSGTIRKVGQGRPCVWITKPWPVVVATRDTAERVSRIISSLTEKKFDWQHNLEQVLASYTVFPVATDVLQTPEDFLRRYPGFASANARAGCWPSRLIKWCVASNLEDRKCRWMREAALAYGLEPAISCNQQADRNACLEAVKTGSVDLFVVKPEEELDARLKGTVPILQAITKKEEDLTVIAALVRNDSSYRTLEDLRGARACFTGYRSIGWNAFVNVMSETTTNESWNCSDLQAVSSFFKDSCVFGLSSSKTDHSIPSNLLSLCRQDKKMLNGTAASYDCLTSGRADVAFVSLQSGLKSKPVFDTPSGTTLRTICVDSNNSTSLPCFLTWSELGSVMVNENMTQLRREEIYAALLEIDIIFGKSFPEHTPAFSLYGPYDSSRNIIFSERTQRLSSDVNHIPLPRNYASVVRRLADRERKSYCNSANRPVENLFKTLMIAFLTACILSAT